MARRLRRKTRPEDVQAPAVLVAPPAAALQALTEEGWSELTALSPEARRKHMHWVHVRTRDTTQRQPSSFTRQGFYEFLEKVYCEAYPEEANESGRRNLEANEIEGPERRIWRPNVRGLQAKFEKPGSQN